MNVGDLKLFEETEADTRKICDAFGLPYELLSTEKGTTFDNKKEAKRQFYQDTIIPEADEWIQALNDFFQTKGKSWSIIGTFDHLPIFQENIKERAAAS